MLLNVQTNVSMPKNQMAFKARLTMGSKAEERLEEMMKTSATKFQSGLNKKESFCQKAIKYLRKFFR